MKPMVAIVGRPNVGKSTLLNRLAGRAVAVVSDIPGVTRDRLFAEAIIQNRDIILVDTGGFEPNPDNDLTRSVVEQVRMAIKEADFILFVCDAKDGLHPIDQTIADLLRKNRKPTLCVINKSDPGASFRQEWEFHHLGLEILPVSALHGTGLSEMAEQVASELPSPTDDHEPEVDVQLKMCLLGRPNVGKSSLANQMAGENRQLVSAAPGTTRDAVDIVIWQDGLSCMLVDTPGVRRKCNIKEKLEQQSVLAALRSLERADVASVVLDATEHFTDQDARLLRLVQDRGKGLIVVVNKIDLWSKDSRKQYLDGLNHGMRFVSYAPVLLVSAITGAGIKEILPEADRVSQSTRARIPTSDLNQLVGKAVSRLQPPRIRGKRAKIYYLTQASVRPPTFIVWVNDPTCIPQNYQRYLERRLRQEFPFPGAPVRWLFNRRSSNRRDAHRKARRKKR